MKFVLPELESLSKEVKTYVAVILLTLLYFAFFPSINNVFFSPALQSFFSNTENSFATDLAFGVVAIAALLLLTSRIVHARKYKFTVADIFLPLLVLGIYLPHRFEIVPGQDWHYLPFCFTKRVFYADSLTLLLLGVIFRQNKKGLTPVPHSNLLLEDAEYTRTRDDIFKRKAYAEKIANLVVGQTTNCSFAVGITAEWGAGKTVFMTQISEALSGCLKIHFNPWLCKTSAQITEDFFSLIVDAVKPYDKNLSARIKAYSRTLLNIEESFPFKISKFFKTNESVGYINIEEQRAAIRNSILKNNLKVIIFIDDLDRLNGAEIMAVLSIIRNSFDFPNMFFFVAYDYDYLIKAMEQEKIQYPASFLRKIFQLDIDLPAYPAILLRDKLIELLIQNKTKEQGHAIAKSVYEIDKNLTIRNFITNLRDCIRLTNSFNHVFYEKFPQVEITDFLLVEILKLYSPKYYYELREQVFNNTPSTFINEDSKNLVLKFNPTNFKNIPNVDRSLENLFQYLFNSEDDLQIKALRKSGNGIRYFSDHLFGQISFADFDQYKQPNGFSGFKNFILDSYKNGKQSELLDLLIRVPLPNDPTEFINLVKGMVVFSNMNGNDSSLIRIYQIFTVANFNFKYNRLPYNWDFIRQLIEPVSFPYLTEVKLAYWLYQAGLRINSPESMAINENIGMRMIELLKRSLEEVKGFDKNCIYIFEYVIKLNNTDWTKRVKLSISQYIRENALHFVKSGLLTIVDEKFFIFNTVIKESLGWDDFQHLLSTIPEDKGLLVLKSAFYVFKKAGYMPVSYDPSTLYIISDQLTAFINSPDYTEFKPMQYSVVNFRPGKLTISEALEDVKGAFWISRAPKSTKDEAIYGGRYLFRRSFKLDIADGMIKSATLYFLVDDYLTVTINQVLAADRIEGFEYLHKTDIMKDIKAGVNDLDFLIENRTYDPIEVAKTDDANPYEFIYNLVIKFEKPFVEFVGNPIFWGEERVAFSNKLH